AITINSALRYFDTPSMKDAFLTGHLTRTLHKIAKDKRRIIIDEGSMLEAEQLGFLYRAVEEANRYPDVKQPLGITIVGDFCLGIGTKVTMADGRLRSIEDVRCGESLMGPDFAPRKVLRLFGGVAPLYRVSQSNGSSYVVTGNHLLALRRGIDGSRLEGKS